MIYIALYITGTIIGSFLIATIYRMESGESNLKGRSKCDSCEHSLTMFDTVPVFGWLMQKGKCRYCSKKISYKYTIFEIFCGLIFVISYWLWGFEAKNWLELLEFTTWLGLVSNLMALSIYDLRNKVIPDIFLVFNAVLGLAFFILQGFGDSLIHDEWWLGLVGSSLLAIVFWCMHKYSKGKWLGEADIYLVAVFGLILGPLFGVISIFLASYFALGYILVAKLLKKKLKLSKQIAFGPFLSLGFVVSYLYGQKIVDLITG